MAFGVWLLHEPLEARFLAGAALVMAGVMLVSLRGSIRWRSRPATSA